ncbi:MAG: hypothetical protein JRI25_22900 [Deltaproteobacteria bacterium]|nr:hypothetical protein [Deltaproteobacteria bacterium]MBW2257426.1 hypothetical protein [Deltaproteobacteria bacterium]
MFPLLLLLIGCSDPSFDVALRLPQDGTLFVTEKTTSTTRTPLGPESLAIKSTIRMDVLQGGRLGTDELHWREEFTRYEVMWENRDFHLEWNMKAEEEIPRQIRKLGPHSPREVWITPDREIFLARLPWPEPEPEEGEEPAPEPSPQLVEEEPGTEEVEEEPAPGPERVSAATNDLPGYFGGLIHAPTEPAKAGVIWSWTIAQQVTGGGDVSSTATWTLERVAGTEAVLSENLVLHSALPPAKGNFRTTGLHGSGEMRFDLNSGLPVSYTSSYEATLASPSALGASTVRTAAKFREKRR